MRRVLRIQSRRVAEAVSRIRELLVLMKVAVIIRQWLNSGRGDCSGQIRAGRSIGGLHRVRGCVLEKTRNIWLDELLLLCFSNILPTRIAKPMGNFFEDDGSGVCSDVEPSKETREWERARFGNLI